MVESTRIRGIGLTPKTHPQGRLHSTLLGLATEGPNSMPLYWLCYRHNHQISVIIEPAASLIQARMNATIANSDQGDFTEGHELPAKWKVPKQMIRPSAVARGSEGVAR